MFQKFLITVLIVLPLSFLVKDPQLGKRVDREIKDEFQVSTFEHEGVLIPAAVRKELPAKVTEDNFFRLKNGKNLIGFAYLDKAPSKTAKFDYMVIFDKDLAIARTKVLVYREEYGGEIGSKRWLRQFDGKTKASEVRNIAAISGATISVRSMKMAVKDLLSSIEILQQKNIL
ncbi:MAG: FMN-binding protein [Salinimicrobium sp.]